jgi:hypothetical protein
LKAKQIGGTSMRTVIALSDWAGFMHVFSIRHISFEVRALNKAQKAKLSDLEGVHKDGSTAMALTFFGVDVP